MSTRKDQRHESPIEYIETAKNLFSHSLYYLPKLGDKRRTLLQVPLLNYVREIVDNVVIVNRTKSNQEIRKQYIFKVLCLLDTFELQLSVVQMSYSQCITDYGWFTFGELIDKLRKLIQGLMK